MLNFFYCFDDDTNLPSDRPELTIDHGAGVLFPDWTDNLSSFPTIDQPWLLVIHGQLLHMSGTHQAISC